MRPIKQIPNLNHVPVIGQQPDPQAVRMALAQQVGSMTRDIYVRAAALKLAEADLTPAELAKQSHEAAKGYFEGLGVAQFERGQ